MAKKLFIGNISWGVNDEGLKELFAKFESLEEAVIIKDKFSGRSKGFGFVTYGNDEDADSAIAEFNEYELDGRNIIVNEAKPPRERDDRF